MRKTLLALALISLPAIAAAQKQPARAADHFTPAARHIDIEDPDEVIGDQLVPDGTSVTARPPSRFTSLIRVRENFVPELIRSANQR